MADVSNNFLHFSQLFFTQKSFKCRQLSFQFRNSLAWKLETAPPIKHYFENQNDVYYVKCIPKTTGNKASLCFCKLLCTCFFFAIFLFLQYFVVLFSQISKWSACTNGNVQFRGAYSYHTKPYRVPTTMMMGKTINWVSGEHFRCQCQPAKCCLKVLLCGN